MSNKNKTSVEQQFKSFLDDLGPALQALRGLDGKKHKRYAKRMEDFLKGSINNPGGILGLVAASVQLPEVRTTGFMVRGKWVNMGELKQRVLAMWQRLGYISKKEIEDRRETTG